ncbi:MAG TPA: exosortase/archaeosortase family protein [Phycisphaerae bacterium]|nr:exosortase/archaeosortase family protein [Phycisphaerae bacterium]
MTQIRDMQHSPGAQSVVPGAMRFNYSVEPAAVLNRAPRMSLVGWGLILAVTTMFLLLYRINLEELVSTWYRNPDFSHGFLIPVISAFFIYLQWQTLKELPVRNSLIGLTILIFAVASQVIFLVHGQIQFSHLSMLVVLFGLVLWLLGWDYLKILWLPICYLIFMINPPQALYVKLTTPLQYVAASAGVHMLPLFGITAARDATVIRILVGSDWQKLNVAEACSGMHMLTAFFALAIALAYSTPRPVWQKIFLALCALPIAIFCNALRVTLTGVLYAYAGQEWAAGSTHENLGLLMLIPAMLMQLGAAGLIDILQKHLFIDDSSGQSGNHPMGVVPS